MKVLEKERIKHVGARKVLLVAILFLKLFEMPDGHQRSNNVSPKTITQLDRQGRAVLKLKSDHLHE